jgi:4-hydroxyphenylpyruvate dioxygenase
MGMGESSCTWVEDATSAYEETMKRGARSLWSLQLRKMIWRSSAFWDLYLQKQFIFFVERKNYKGIFLPGYKNGNQITIQNQQV